MSLISISFSKFNKMDCIFINNAPFLVVILFKKINFRIPLSLYSDNPRIANRMRPSICWTWLFQALGIWKRFYLTAISKWSVVSCGEGKCVDGLNIAFLNMAFCFLLGDRLNCATSLSRQENL